MPDLVAELLADARETRREARDDRAAQLRALEKIAAGMERVATGADRHEVNAGIRSDKILLALGAQEARDAVVAATLAQVTHDGKRAWFAGLTSILRALPPPLKKEITWATIKLIALAIFLVYVHFGVPTSTIIEVAQAMIQPLAAAHP